MGYIWQCELGLQLRWDSGELLSLLGKARLAQGNLLGRVKRLGFGLDIEAQVDILTEETVKTAAFTSKR